MQNYCKSFHQFTKMNLDTYPYGRTILIQYLNSRTSSEYEDCFPWDSFGSWTLVLTTKLGCGFFDLSSSGFCKFSPEPVGKSLWRKVLGISSELEINWKITGIFACFWKNAVVENSLLNSDNNAWSWATLFRALSSHQVPSAHLNQEYFPAKLGKR